MSENHWTWREVHLHALRGVAALVVVFGHARGLFFSSLTGTAAFTGVATVGGHAAPSVEGLTIGHEAVMIFFVLSGYLVGGSVAKSIFADSWSWQKYLVKRLVRLWIVLVPAIVIGLMIDDIGMRFFGNSGGIYSFPDGQPYVTPAKFTEGHYLSTIIGNVFFLQTIFVPLVGTNAALWSLSNEFWYYLLFPMIILALRRTLLLPQRLIYGGMAFIIFFLIGAHASYLFFIWVIGAAIASLRPIVPENKAGLAVFTTTTLAFVVIISVKKWLLPLASAELLIGIVTAALIYAIKCQNGESRFPLYDKCARFFSDISYTLYLTHLPLLVFLCGIVNSPWSRWPLSIVAISKFCLIVTTAILWATLMHRLFEANTDHVRRFVMRQLADIRSGFVATRK